MADLISRAAAIAEIDEYLHGLDSCISEPDLKLDGYKKGLQVAIQELNALPAVDAVPVVRCKDCKNRDVTGPYPVCRLDSADPWEQTRNADEDDWFCAEGKRRDDDGKDA